jgi:hypothetical protein
MKSETLFIMALGLQTLWQVKDMTFSTDELARSELHLHIDFVPGSRFPDEANELCPEHDTVERQWRHLSFLSTPVTFIVRCRALLQPMAKFVPLMFVGPAQGVALLCYSKRWR